MQTPSWRADFRFEHRKVESETHKTVEIMVSDSTTTPCLAGRQALRGSGIVKGPKPRPRERGRPVDES